MCWQRQAARYTCDLQVSREMLEQRRALQPSACEHTMRHAFVSSRETCFVTWMEKGAAACCTAYFSLMHIVLGIYTVPPGAAWPDTAEPASRHVETEAAGMASNAGVLQPSLCLQLSQHVSASAVPWGRRWTDAASLLVKDTDAQSAPLHHSGRRRKRGNVRANVLSLCKFVFWDICSNFRPNPSRETFNPSTADLWSDVFLSCTPDNLSSNDKSQPLNHRGLQGHTDTIGMQGKVLDSCPHFMLNHLPKGPETSRCLCYANREQTSSWAPSSLECWKLPFLKHPQSKAPKTCLLI